MVRFPIMIMTEFNHGTGSGATANLAADVARSRHALRLLRTKSTGATTET